MSDSKTATITARVVDGADLSEPDRVRIITGVLVSMFMAALDQTIVAPVIPTLGTALGGTDYISWIVSAYFLTSTATTPLYGKIADIRGRRLTLIAAIAIFVVGSVVCAMARSMGVLILGRAIQGLGGGGLVALAQTVIADLTPPKDRGRISGHIAVMWGVASVGGPVVGGFIAEHAHWSLIFWLNVPLAIFAAFIVNGSLKRLPWQRRNHKLDITGSLLVVTASVLAMVALALAPQPQHGLSSPLVIASALASCVMFGIVWRHMQTANEPLIPVAVLSNRVVALATSSVFFCMAVNLGLAVFVPLFLELALHESASHAGMGLVVFMIGTVIAANISGRTLAYVEHYKRLPMIGLAVGAAALIYVAVRSASIGLVEFEVMLFAVGAGLGFQFPVTTVAIQNAVDPRDIGVATGLNAFMRALGSSLGVAVVGAVGAASGIAIGAEGVTSGGAAPVGRAALHFAPLFLVLAGILGVSLVLLWLMPERPLRGQGRRRAA